MSYDIKLNDKQKIWVMKGALEKIKDAPLTKDEVESLIRETLHLVDFGTYDLPKKLSLRTIVLKAYASRTDGCRMTDAQENGVKRWRCNCIPVPRQVLAESDHERVVADLEAQVFNEGIRHRHEANELDKTIATQAKEIEKLKFIQGPP